MVAVPSLTPVTLPFRSTVAILVSLLAQVTAAPLGSTVAVSCTVLLAATVALSGATVREVAVTPLMTVNLIFSLLG